MINDYRNPVGSVQVQQDYGRTSDVNGSIMNQGVFSPNNPYLDNMRLATGEDDKNRWYQAAVQWEADNYNTQESREYNSPINQIAREREAGINPDIAGTSGSSGSSGSASGSTIPQQQINTDFTTEAEKTSLIFEGFNTASNLITSFVGLGDTIVKGVDMMSTLPSRVNLLDAQANLANTSANVAQELLPSQKMSNILGNIDITTQLVGNISKIFPNDISDEDLSTNLQAMGVPADMTPSFISAIKSHRKSDLSKNYFNTLKDQYNQSSSKLAFYTPEFYSKFYDVSTHCDLIGKDMTLSYNNLKNSLYSYLNENGYANSKGANLIKSETVTADSLKLQGDKLKHDIKVFTEQVNSLAELYNDSKKLVDDITSKFTYKDIFGNIKTRPLTPEANAIVNSELMRQVSLYQLGSNQLSQLYSFRQEMMSNRHIWEDMLQPNNGFMTGSNRQVNRKKLFNTLIFGNVIAGTPLTEQDVVTEMSGTVPILGDLLKLF